jgi:predicted metal-dependent hydrolase
MKTKWGVCRPREGRVTLNRNLVYLPPSLVDYVICHELAHFHHADHSAAFWQYLATVMPDCKARRKALNAFAIPRLKVPSAK